MIFISPYLVFYRQNLNKCKLFKIMKAIFCSGILLHIYHIGYFIADSSLTNFRWQNAKQ